MNSKTVENLILGLEKESNISKWHEVFKEITDSCESEALLIHTDESFKGGSITTKTIKYPKVLRKGRCEGILVKFISAEANNIITLFGSSQIGLEGEMAGKIKKELETNYSYLLKLINENFDNNPKIMIGKLSAKNTYRNKKSILHIPVTGPRIGIDVGGTSINICLIDSGKIIQSINIYSFAHDETFKKFLNRLINVLKSTKWKKKYAGIGIAWFGDVRNDEPLKNVDILERLMDEAALITSFPKIISKELKVPVRVWGDSEALGFYYSKKKKVKNCWILRIGTSLGGAYINGNHRFDYGFHLVSRIVINMNYNAFRHTSTGIPGMSQQYVGDHAFKRLLDRENILYDKEGGAGKKLKDMLEASDSEKQIALGIVDTIADSLSEVILELSKHSEVSSIVLGGTPISGLLGKSIFDNLRNRSLNVEINEDNLPIRYAGAFAAAELLNLM